MSKAKGFSRLGKNLGGEVGEGLLKGSAKELSQRGATGLAKKTAGQFDDDLAKSVLKRNDSMLSSQALAKFGKTAPGEAAKETTEQVTKKGTRKFSKSTAKKVALVGGGIAGGAAVLKYVEDKYEKADEEEKQCTALCLPGNWDNYKYGSVSKNELKYKTIDDVKTEFPDATEDDTPLCNDTIAENCEEFCSEKCIKSVNLPFVPEKPIEKFFKPFNDIFSGLGDLIGNPSKIFVYVAVCLCIIMLIAMVSMAM